MQHAAKVFAVSLLALSAGCNKPAASTKEAPAKTTTAASGDSNTTAEVGLPPEKPRIACGELRFVEGYRQGYEQALREGKPMLLFFTAEWCRFCHQMADEAFSDEQVVELSRNFVCILVDADLEPAVCEQFHVEAYPTIQFLSSRGAPLNRTIGKKPGTVLGVAMQMALETVAQRDSASGVKRL